MKFIIRGKNIDVTESIKSYIENKLGRLDKYFENPYNITATANVTVKGNKQIVEVTIPTKKNGHGYGLVLVKQILEKNKKFNHDISIFEDCLIQRINIKRHK